MSRLGRADTKQDSQYFWMGHPLCQRWIETVAALFDRRHMESCRVGNRLNVGVRSQIGVRPRDCRKLPLVQAGDRLGERKSRVEVRVVSSAATKLFEADSVCFLGGEVWRSSGRMQPLSPPLILAIL